MIHAISGEQERHRRPGERARPGRVGHEQPTLQHLSNQGPDRTRARLARLDHFEPRCVTPCPELGVRRATGAVDAFDDHEQARKTSL